MKPIVILISGGGSNMVTLVQSMVGDHPARPCLVLANDPGAGGLDKAAALGVPTAVIDGRFEAWNRWDYTNGVVLSAFSIISVVTGNALYFDYNNRFYD